MVPYELHVIYKRDRNIVNLNLRHLHPSPIILRDSSHLKSLGKIVLLIKDATLAFSA
jgi:hypothetical protein